MLASPYVTFDAKRPLGVRSERRDEDWRLVWSDEFEGRDVDWSKWTAERAPSGRVNGEAQRYERGNASVNDGKLVIEARRDADGYSSARLTSVGKGDWRYGRVVVAAKVPPGRGTWPAIWMLPSHPSLLAEPPAGDTIDSYPLPGGWPNGGEIDIAEWSRRVGYDTAGNYRVLGTIHTELYNHLRGTQRGAATGVPNAFDRFHTYELVWDPEQLEWRVDGELYFVYRNPHIGKGAWPFDQPFHLILNLALGGDLGGDIDAAALPQRFEIDYVRVYAGTPRKPLSGVDGRAR